MGGEIIMLSGFTVGKTTNTSLVMANTSSRGKDCCLQVFIVPIRDFETHHPLPGEKVFSLKCVTDTTKKLSQLFDMM